MKNTHLPEDPVQWVKDLEQTWQSMDSKKARQGYTDDAFMVFGCEQNQSGEEMLNRPKDWFNYATDLKINKNYISHSNDCIVASWNSSYTDPKTKKIMCERGIEYFRFRNGKVCEQHAWQHSWAKENKPMDSGITTS